MDYRNKVILAPMVRIGTLPTRLLALDYGADIVYTEEIIDYKILQCKRCENEVLGTVDFVWNDGTVVFRTCDQEKGKVVFQLGTCDADRALKAVKLVERDVAAVDVNMGCPKEFSIKGGMGAALLTQPDKVKQILTSLVQGLKIPVTCKIRILPTISQTVELARMIESTGVAALAVHGRTKEERSRDANHSDFIRAVAESLTIPVIAKNCYSGGSREHISAYPDIETFREHCGATSVMVARAAQWNTSVFRKQGLLPVDDVIKAYLQYAMAYFPVVPNVKYNLQQFCHKDLETPRGKQLLAATSMQEICALWGMSEEYQAVLNRQEEKRQQIEGCRKAKKRKLHDGSTLIEMDYKFDRKEFGKTSPKMILHQWTIKESKRKPHYETKQNPDDKLFFSILSLEGVKYAPLHWEKSKKAAEQAAAGVCLSYLGVNDGRITPDGVIQYNTLGGLDHNNLNDEITDTANADNKQTKTANNTTSDKLLNEVIQTTTNQNAQSQITDNNS